MKNAVPSLFVSHGLPPIALLDDPYNSALINFGRSISPDIKGIVCISSHWVSPGAIQIASAPDPFIQHNFSGYQKEIYDLEYSPPFSPDLIQQVATLLDENDFEVSLNPHYGLDHGVWMPLRLIRPEADLPVVQISLPLNEDPRKIMKIGHGLSVLREQGILLIGSGAAGLNPHKLIWHARGEDVHPKIAEFDSWLVENLKTADVETILDYKKSGPHNEFVHPGSSNISPLFFTMGAALSGDRPQFIFKGFKYSSTSLLTFCLSENPISNELLS